MRVEHKACNKCGGDVTERRDRYGTYRQCLQCGNNVYNSPWEKQEQPARPKRNPFAAEAKKLAQKRHRRIQPRLL